MKKKKIPDEPTPQAETKAEREKREWAEEFDKSDHTHFLRLSAELVQEAGNVASRSESVTDMLAVAAQWGTLAEYARDLTKGERTIGFTNATKKEPDVE